MTYPICQRYLGILPGITGSTLVFFISLIAVHIFIDYRKYIPLDFSSSNWWDYSHTMVTSAAGYASLHIILLTLVITYDKEEKKKKLSWLRGSNILFRRVQDSSYCNILVLWTVCLQFVGIVLQYWLGIICWNSCHRNCWQQICGKRAYIQHSPILRNKSNPFERV